MKSTTYCVLPWIHLATHPHGEMSLCCRVDFNESIGMAFDTKENGRHFYNLNREPIDQIINSESFCSTRLKMLNGEQPKACKGCYSDESLGLVSKRQRENQIFNLNPNDLKMRTDRLGRITPDIQYAELRLGNLCNLSCRTCNPNSSSKWISEYKSLQENLSFVRKYDLHANYKWAENENFWNDFLNYTKSLRFIYINGGEPTLIKQHWIFLEKLIHLNLSQNIELKYNINMTHLPAKAFELWRKFKYVKIGASVDDLNIRNSYIRSGSVWDQIVENLFRIRDAGFDLAIEQTVSAYNVYYLDEMEKFSNDNKIGYGLNFVFDPEYLSVKCLPEKIKQYVLKKLENSHYPRFFLDEVAAKLKAESSEQLWNQFKSYNHFLDKTRNEKFELVFSEFNELLCENHLV